jgi:hypothetical protein
MTEELKTIDFSRKGEQLIDYLNKTIELIDTKNKKLDEIKGILKKDRKKKPAQSSSTNFENYLLSELTETKKLHNHFHHLYKLVNEAPEFVFHFDTEQKTEVLNRILQSIKTLEKSKDLCAGQLKAVRAIKKKSSDTPDNVALNGRGPLNESTQEEANYGLFEMLNNDENIKLRELCHFIAENEIDYYNTLYFTEQSHLPDDRETKLSLLFIHAKMRNDKEHLKLRNYLIPLLKRLQNLSPDDDPSKESTHKLYKDLEQEIETAYALRVLDKKPLAEIEGAQLNLVNVKLHKVKEDKVKNGILGGAHDEFQKLLKDVNLQITMNDLSCFLELVRKSMKISKGDKSYLREAESTYSYFRNELINRAYDEHLTPLKQDIQNAGGFDDWNLKTWMDFNQQYINNKEGCDNLLKRYGFKPEIIDFFSTQAKLINKGYEQKNYSELEEWQSSIVRGPNKDDWNKFQEILDNLKKGVDADQIEPETSKVVEAVVRNFVISRLGGMQEQQSSEQNLLNNNGPRTGQRPKSQGSDSVSLGEPQQKRKVMRPISQSSANAKVKV